MFSPNHSMEKTPVSIIDFRQIKEEFIKKRQRFRRIDIHSTHRVGAFTAKKPSHIDTNARILPTKTRK